MAADLKELAKVVWREGRFPKLWAFFTALPGIAKHLLGWFNVKVEDISPYLPEPAWWWGLVVLGLWILYVIYAMAERILVYETTALDVRPFRSTIDGSWWVDVVNTGNRLLNSCVLNLDRLENDRGERVFPQRFALVRPGGGRNPFPLRGHESKQARFASLRKGQIILHVLNGDGAEKALHLEDMQYTAVLTVCSDAEGAYCEKRLTLLRGDNFLNVS